MRRIPSESGFALIIILLFLQFFSVLGMFALLTSHRTLKIINRSWQVRRHWFAARRGLQVVEASVFQGGSMNCEFRSAPAEYLMSQSSEWWKAHACNGKVTNETYYYMIESLAEDACAYIAKSYDNQVYVAKYYRITLRLRNVFLQSTIAMPIRMNEPCRERSHWVKQGQQMWREGM